MRASEFIKQLDKPPGKDSELWDRIISGLMSLVNDEACLSEEQQTAIRQVLERYAYRDVVIDLFIITLATYINTCR